MSELIARATRALHDTGGRMTAQRRAVLEALEDMGGHPTAEEIYLAARARDSTIDPSTVYRTLSWLEAVGLLSPAWLGHERSRRQEPAAGPLPVEHHHFICTGCGNIIEFAMPEVEAAKAAVARVYGVTVGRAALTLYGLCADCRTEEDRVPAKTTNPGY